MANSTSDGWPADGRSAIPPLLQLPRPSPRIQPSPQRRSVISLITTSCFAKSYGSSAMPGPKSGSAPVYESSGSRVPPSASESRRRTR